MSERPKCLKCKTVSNSFGEELERNGLHIGEIQGDDGSWVKTFFYKNEYYGNCYSDNNKENHWLVFVIKFESNELNKFVEDLDEAINTVNEFKKDSDKNIDFNKHLDDSLMRGFEDPDKTNMDQSFPNDLINRFNKDLDDVLDEITLVQKNKVNK